MYERVPEADYRHFESSRQAVRDAMWESIETSDDPRFKVKAALMLAENVGDERALDLITAVWRREDLLAAHYQLNEVLDLPDLVKALVLNPTEQRLDRANLAAQQIPPSIHKGDAFMVIAEASDGIRRDSALTYAVEWASIPSDRDNDDQARLLIKAGTLKQQPDYYKAGIEKVSADPYWVIAFPYKLKRLIEHAAIQAPGFEKTLIGQIYGLYKNADVRTASSVFEIWPNLDDEDRPRFLSTLAHGGHRQFNDAEYIAFLDLAAMYEFYTPREMALEKWRAKRQRAKNDRRKTPGASADFHAWDLIELGYDEPYLLDTATYDVRDVGAYALTENERRLAAERLNQYVAMHDSDEFVDVILDLRDHITDESTRFAVNFQLIKRGNTNALQDAERYLLTEQPWLKHEGLFAAEFGSIDHKAAHFFYAVNQALARQHIETVGQN